MLLQMMLLLLFGTSWSAVSYRPRPAVGVVVLAFVVAPSSSWSSPPRRVSGDGGSHPTTTTTPFLSCGSHRCRQRQRPGISLAAASVKDEPEPDWNTSDPYRLLGLARDSSSDTKAIKRAYRRLALRYHPDVVTGAAEKKVAAERFAKINWAYQMAKSGQTSSTTTSSGTSTGSSSSTSGWEPPHRRSGSYRSSSSSSSDSASSGTPSSTDWRDYMPRDYQNDDAQYDAGGDSFEKILSDLFQGATAVVGGGGGGGIFKDFVEFLEQNVDGYSSGGRDDAEELRVLLQTGDVQEIRDEMDETELVVQQLTHKLQNVRDEKLQVQANLAAVSRYMEKMELQERMDELQARQTVVEGYMQRAKKRLVALQTRYKELLVRGTPNDRRGGQSSSQAASSWEDVKRESSSESATSRRSTPSSSDPDEAWKDEGFGSFGRGSGSSRRRAPRRTTGTDVGSPSRASSTTTENSSSSWSSSRSGSSTSQSESPSRQASRATDESTTRVVSQQDPYVPPHRRKSAFVQQQDDQRRLREIKVDEEFDKLKKELGL